MRNRYGYECDAALLSHDARYYIKNTPCGPGKTYGRKFSLLKRYCQKTERFLCIFRMPADLNTARKSWLDNLIYPDPCDRVHKPYDPERFKWVGSDKTGYYNLMVDDDPIPAGYFRCLSNINQVKEENFSLETCWAWMDEYLPMCYKKIPGIDNEGQTLQIMVDRLDHDLTHSRKSKGYKDVKCILYGNVHNIASPLLSYFGVDPMKKGIYRASKDVMVETIPPKPSGNSRGLPDERNPELFGNPYAFVEKKPPSVPILYSLRIRQHYYAFCNSWSFNPGCLHIESVNKHVCNAKYGTMENLQEDEKFIGVRFDFKMWDTYYKGMMSRRLLRFGSPWTKTQFMEDIGII